MAAFALGLLADTTAVPALTTALQDAEPRVRGRAAEALGRIGATEVGGRGRPDGGELREAGRDRVDAPDDEKWPETPEADAVRLGLFALVRQKATSRWPPRCSMRSGTRRGWWPVAFALQRIDDPRAHSGAAAAVPRRPALHASVRGARPRRAKDRRGRRSARWRSLGRRQDVRVEVSVSAVRALAQIGAPAAAEPLVALASEPAVDDPNVRLEAVTALGTLEPPRRCRTSRICSPTSGRRCGRRRCARGRGDRSRGLPASCCPAWSRISHWVVRAAIADVLAHDARPRSRSRACARCSTTRTSASCPAVIDSLARLKAPDLETAAARAAQGTRLRGPRAAAARDRPAEAGGRSGGAARRATRWRRPTPPRRARGRPDGARRVRRGGSDATLKAALADTDWAMRAAGGRAAREARSGSRDRAGDPPGRRALRSRRTTRRS